MRLDLLILARLAGGTKLVRSDLVRQLRPLAAPETPVAEFRKILDGRLTALRDGGAVRARPLGLTDAGRRRLLDELRLDIVPPWRELRDLVLPALALGVSRAELSDVRMAIVAQLLVRHLELRTRMDSSEAIVKLAAAFAIKAPRTDAASLRRALVQRWASARPVFEPAADPAPVDVAAPRWTGDDVIAAVRDVAARTRPPGRFGDEKVFIAAIWRQLEGSGAFPGLTLDALKEHLVAASQRRLVTLARADLVAAMDPAEVAASEIRVRTATFHFVVDRPRD